MLGADTKKGLGVFARGQHFMLAQDEDKRNDDGSASWMMTIGRVERVEVGVSMPKGKRQNRKDQKARAPTRRPREDESNRDK